MVDLSESMWNVAFQPLKTSYPTTTVPMTTKLGRTVTYLNGLLPIKSLDPLITWSCKVTWQAQDNYISPTIMPIATKLDRMMTYLRRLPPIKLFNPLVTWSFYKITWQAKTIISPLSQCLRSTNLASWWLTLRGSSPYGHMILNQEVLPDFVTIWTIYISTFTRFMVIKLIRVLTSGRRFRTHTFKSSPTSRFNLIC